MKRLITFTVVFAVVFCTSCEKKPNGGEGEGGDTTVVIPPKKYVIGNYYNVNGVQGIVYKVEADSTKGMLVSLDETTVMWVDTNNISIRYVSTGAVDSENGVENMKKVEEKGFANFPAFDWCNKKNTGNIKGWYLPSSYELWDVANVCGQLQDSLAANKGTRLDNTGTYWSSTDCGDIGGIALSAYAVRFSDKNVSPTFKGLSHKVRAVRAF